MTTTEQQARRAAEEIESFAKELAETDLLYGFYNSEYVQQRVQQIITRHVQSAGVADCEWCAKGFPLDGTHLHDMTPDAANDETHLYRRCQRPKVPTISDAIAEVERLRDGWRADYNATDDNECEEHCSSMMDAAREIIEALRALQGKAGVGDCGEK